MHIEQTFFSISQLIKRVLRSDRGKLHIEMIVKKVGTESLCFNIEKKLTNLVYFSVIECLVNEYQNEKNENELIGETVEQRTEYFLSSRTTPEYLEVFFKKYPVLKMQLIRKIEDYQDYVLEILTNYSKNKNNLNQLYGISLGKVNDISLSLGDKHDGKTVSIVSCENMEIVYKPRKLDTDLLVYELVDLVDNLNDVRINIRRPLILNGKNYSWQEYIKPESCNNFQGVERYYKRAGMYLAIFFILGATDLHYENLIASGEHPMFIDLETISYGKQNESVRNYQFKTYETSVLSTALLPMNTNNGIFDVNLSGLFTKNQQSKSIINSVLSTHDEYDWVYINQPFDFLPTANLVTLNDKVVNVELVLPILKSSFSNSLKVIQDHKKLFFETMYNNLSSEMQIRQLIRPTRVYGKFLEFSTSPKYLTSFNAQENLFDILFSKFEIGEHGYLRVEEEIAKMKEGYIPSFYSHPNEKHLYSNGKVICENYYMSSFVSFFEEKLNLLTNDVILYQERFIEFSTASLHSSSELMTLNNNFEEHFIDKSQIDELLHDYLSYQSKFFINLTQDEVDYFSLFAAGEIYTLANGSYGLYDTGGLIVLLFSSDKYRQVALKMYNNLLARLKFEMEIDEKSDMSPSIFTGIGGMMYLSLFLYKHTLKQSYLDDFYFTLTAVYELVQVSEKGNYFDYISGIAGIIHFLANAKENFPNIDLGDIYILINILFDDYMMIQDIGLAHGKAGLGVGLASAYAITNDKDIFEKALIIRDELVEFLLLSNLDSSWCKGSSGILMGIKMLEDKLDDHAMADFRELESRMFNEANEMGQLCLCHGSFGVLDVLYSMKDENEKNDFGKQLLDKFDLPDIRKTKWMKGMDSIYDSFMIGATGVLYTMKRLQGSDLPSITCLEF